MTEQAQAAATSILANMPAIPDDFREFLRSALALAWAQGNKEGYREAAEDFRQIFVRALGQL